MKKFWNQIAFSLMMVLVTAASLHAAEWKYALEVVQGDVQDIYAQEFKRRIEEKTKGEITIKIYHYGTLGTSSDLTELAAEGALQFTNASPGHLGTFIPEVQLFAIPFMLSDNPEVNKHLLTSSKAIYEDLANDFERRGIKLMTMYPEGNMVWTTNRVIRSPKEFKNFKMRVLASPMMLEAYKDFGASPTPIPFGEVYGALQLGAIDGMVNPVSSIYSMKFYEVTPNLIWPRHKLFTTTIITGCDWYKALPPEHKKLISETFKETSGWLINALPELEKGFVEKIQNDKPDVKNYHLTDEEREPFMAASMTTRSKYVKKVGKRGQEILDTFLSERAALEAGLGVK